MTWRRLRFSHYDTRCRSIPLSKLRPQRHASTLRAKDANISSILTQEPSATEVDDPILVTGSIRTIRKQKRRCFLEIGDGSTLRPLQAVLEPQQAEGLGTGTSVALTGLWQRSPAGKEQHCELNAQTVRILGPTDSEKYPLQKKFHTSEYLRTIPHLRLRTPFAALLARLRSECDYHFANYFRSEGFIRLQPPIITSSDCEGAGEVFTVGANYASKNTTDEDNAALRRQDHFFRDPKYLTVSSQLHLEAFVLEHPKVWTLSPTFRAERSDTPRHVSEFWMLEAELRTESLCDVTDAVESAVRYLITNLQKSPLFDEILGSKRRDGTQSSGHTDATSNLVSARWDKLAQSRWPRISYTEAIAVLKSADAANKTNFHYPPSWLGGLQHEHEKFIAEVVGQGSPVFVTDYPQDIKPFYMLPSVQNRPSTTEEANTAACFDLLLPDGCEVVGGSLREHRLQPLLQSMRKRGLRADETDQQGVGAKVDALPSDKPGNLDWYADLRRYGSVPHGGFGLGLDRLLGHLTGVHSIRDIVPWPRYHGRCDC